MKKQIGKLLLFSTAVALLSGCSDIESPTLHSMLPRDVLYEARISTNSVRMQLGDSLQLAVMIYSVDGTQLHSDSVDRIVWSSSNSENLTVSPSGLIKGWKSSTSPVNVSVVVSNNMVTKTHRIPVYITDDRLDITAIKLVALDSQRVSSRHFSGVNNERRLPRVRVDLYKDGSVVQSGVNLPLIAPPQVGLQYISSEGVFHVSRNDGWTGEFTVSLSGNLYGAEMGDSLTFVSLYSAMSVQAEVGYRFTLFEDINSPYQFGISIDSTWYNRISINDAYITQPCAIIEFRPFAREIYDYVLLFHGQVFSYPKIDIVFDDSSSAVDCETSNPDTSKYEMEVIGGNIYGWSPFRSVIRKSSTIGEVNWYAQDSETKIPIGISGKYIAGEVGI